MGTGRIRTLWTGRLKRVRPFAFVGFALQIVAMKPRHAAALALVGWYLMVPPYSALKTVTDATTGQRRFPTQTEIEQAAPLSAWTLGAGFDLAAECYHFHTEAIADEKAHMDRALKQPGDPKNMDVLQKIDRALKQPRNPKNMDALQYYVMWSRSRHAVCIASDDPRLKPK